MRSSSVREVIKYNFGWRSIRDVVPRATFNAVVQKLLFSRYPALATHLANLDLTPYKNRPYHNFEHLIHLAELAEAWNDDPENHLNLLTAIMAHDLKVDSDPGVEPGTAPHLNARACTLLGLADPDLQAVSQLIEATDHQHHLLTPNHGLTPAQTLMARLDLAILGESPFEYNRYVQATLAEYGHLNEAFLARRRTFLSAVWQKLAAGPLINPEYDRQAQDNIRRELA